MGYTWDDSIDIITYQCDKYTVHWSCDEKFFTVYNNRYIRQVAACDMCGRELSDMAKHWFNCSYKELLSVIASMIITYTYSNYNKSDKTAICEYFTIDKDEAKYRNKVYFTHDINENAKIMQDGLDSGGIHIADLKYITFELLCDMQ